VTSNGGYYTDSIWVTTQGNQDFFVGMADCNNSWQSKVVSNQQGTVQFVNLDFQLCFSSNAGGGCSADFVSNPDIAGGFHFYGQSVGTGLSYAWDFGDGNTSTLSTPYHAYANPGTYSVCLTIDNGNGCIDTYCDSVTTANASACSPLFTQLYHLGTTVHLSYVPNASFITTLYSWDFGDGSIASGQIVNHTYTAPGTYLVCITANDVSTGCIATYCDSVVVSNSQGVGGSSGSGNNCQANFSSSLDIAGSYYFYDFSVGSGLSYAWNFGDGDTSTLANPYHTYANPGTYSVCLTIDDGNGCIDTYCDSLVVSNTTPTCNAIFTQLPLSGATVTLFGSGSIGSTYVHSWDFGDGNTGSGASVNHTYAASGTYYVCYTVSNATIGCTDTYCDSVVVNGGASGGPPCDAEFFTIIDPNGLVDFINDSFGSGLAYAWDFGDGHTSTDFEPYHAYANPGTYFVCLTVNNGSGCVDTYCDSVAIANFTPGCDAFFLQSSQPGNTVAFTSTVPVTTTYAHSWDFGDGSTGNGAYINHTYADTGTYFVCYTVNNLATGCTDAHCDSVAVINQGSGSNCDAEFDAWPDSNGFIDFANYSVGGGPTTYLWDFGDGNTSTLTEPYYAYANPGTYFVCLTMNDWFGCVDTYCDSVVVTNVPPGCSAFFAHTSQQGTAVAFSSSTPSIATYVHSWDFGDGSTGSGATITHTYANPGIYFACLTITDSVSGCTDTYCNNVVVTNQGSGSNCDADFMATPDTSGFVDFFNLSGGSSSANLSYLWDFGDGSTSILAQPFYGYANPGTYLVCLTVNDMATGCTDTYCDSVVVVSQGSSSNCQAAFVHSVQQGGVGIVVDFTASSSPGYSFHWDFGDGNSSGWTSSNTVQHTYGAVGTYNVTLIVLDSANNCSDSTWAMIALTNGPTGTNWVGGSVFAGSSLILEDCQVFLIQYDSANAILTAVDSTAVVSGTYDFGLVANGSYFVKAALEPGNPNYSTYMPSYYGPSLLWSTAATIDAPSAFGWYDIDLIAGSNPGGPGFIGGNVWQGANKTATEGDPVEGVHILLLDENDNPAAHISSNADGEYQFSNLAYGTYKIWAEVWGKNTTPNLATIDQGSETHNDVNIVIGETEVTTFIEIVNGISASQVGLLPNPFNSQAIFSFDIEQGGNYRMTFINAVGQQIMTVNETLSAGVSNVVVNTNHLPEGMYFVNITSNIGLDFTRKVVKTR